MYQTDSKSRLVGWSREARVVPVLDTTEDTQHSAQFSWESIEGSRIIIGWVICAYVWKTIRILQVFHLYYPILHGVTHAIFIDIKLCFFILLYYMHYAIMTKISETTCEVDYILWADNNNLEAFTFWTWKNLLMN